MHHVKSEAQGLTEKKKLYAARERVVPAMYRECVGGGQTHTAALFPIGGAYTAVLVGDSLCLPLLEHA